MKYWRLEEWEPRRIGGPGWVPLAQPRTIPTWAAADADFEKLASAGRIVRLIEVTETVVVTIPPPEVAP